MFNDGFFGFDLEIFGMNARRHHDGRCACWVGVVAVVGTISFRDEATLLHLSLEVIDSVAGVVLVGDRLRHFLLAVEMDCV